MARSERIYLIIDPEQKGIDSVVATFTVKYEMLSFIEHHQLDMTKLQIHRLPDGKFPK